ncbi:MAG TPA: hypothetical protein PLW50_00405 [Smithellaceae bacterium]|nr:hypothetical protein [Smithellaceae bacterium]
MGNKHPKKKEQVCKVCGAVFTNGGLRGHMNTHSTKPVTDVECKICGKPFNTRTIKGHMAMVHPKNGLPHPAVARIGKVWEGLTEEQHLARVKAARDSRFKNNDNAELTYLQRQMVLGSLLGDMNIHRQHKGVTDTAHPELRIAHSTDQRAYVQWKYELLKPIARDRGIYEFDQKTGFGKGFGTCRFETRALKCLEEIYDLTKDASGKKRVTEKWLNEIDHPIALAAWYMDDGSMAKGCVPWFAMGLSTDDEVGIMQAWLLKKWGIDTTYRRDKGNYNDNTYAIVTVAYDSRDKFFELVRPYTIPSMEYKLSKCNTVEN